MRCSKVWPQVILSTKISSIIFSAHFRLLQHPWLFLYQPQTTHLNSSLGIRTDHLPAWVEATEFTLWFLCSSCSKRHAISQALAKYALTKEGLPRKDGKLKQCQMVLSPSTVSLLSLSPWWSENNHHFISLSIATTHHFILIGQKDYQIKVNSENTVKISEEMYCFADRIKAFLDQNSVFVGASSAFFF